MPKRTANEIREYLRQEKNLFPGQSVKWEVTGGHPARLMGERFGCVLDTTDEQLLRGKLVVVASNGKHELDASMLTAAPDCDDPVMLDHKAIYGRK